MSGEGERTEEVGRSLFMYPIYRITTNTPSVFMLIVSIVEHNYSAPYRLMLIVKAMTGFSSLYLSPTDRIEYISIPY